MIGWVQKWEGEVKKTAIDRIWDLVLKLDEDDGAMTGKINYRGGAGGCGRLTAVLDGRRISVYVQEAEGEE